MESLIYFSILTILFLEFVFNRTLSFLNIKHSSQPIPEELKDLYDEERYQKQQSYLRTNAKFGLIVSTFSFLFVFCMFAFGGYAEIDSIARSLTSNALLVTLLFFAIIKIIDFIIDIPFDFYATFVIEERFGFNRTTKKTFVLDLLKSLLLSMLISGIILSVIFVIYEQIPNWFWLLAWASMSAFSLFMSLFYSNLIVPLFNKQTPLEEGELRNAIQVFAEKTNFKLKNIYVINGSKRSSKANAYFTGLGVKKRIVLYDTLIQQLSTEEIVAVLAHEIGHNKHQHTLKNLLISLTLNLLLFFIFGIILKYDVFAQAIGCQLASFHVNMLVFSTLYSPISMLLGFWRNVLSRKFEYQADAFVKENGMEDALISSLKKISSQALSNLTPHPLVVRVRYSHPTLYQRIVALKK